MNYFESITIRLLITVFFFLGFAGLSKAQEYPGSAKDSVSLQQMKMQQGIVPFQSATASQQDDSQYHTTVFTFTDIVVFAYANDTEITIVDANGNTVKSTTLQENEYDVSSLSTGVYRIFGSKAFTALIGDATSNLVQGYYAVDQSGRGTSTLFNTYMMGQYTGEEKFIVSAYEDGTEFTIKNLETGELLHAGVLNKDEHFTMSDTPYNTFLQVSASKPVSALSYGDQDYYVPAENGSFSGKNFLGYSAYIGSWTNSITVTGYHDDTNVSIINTKTGETINSYTINEGEVRTEPINTETYWKVEADKTVTAANIPYAGWTGNYYYKTRAIDKEGVGAGTLFYVPTIQSQINVFSFEDANNVTIQRLGQNTDYPYSDPTTVFDGTLDAGEGYSFESQSGRYVYKVEGSENVSVVQSNGGAGAEFMPLSFAQELPDLAVSADNIIFDPDKDKYEEGEEINVTIQVNNFGPIEATDIPVKVYQGDPDGEGTAPLLYEETLSTIGGNSSKSISFTYTVPREPEFRRMVVKVDPESQIEESNDSNNKAGKSIEPNEDLLPPLAVTVDVTGSLRLNDSDQLEPNPFPVDATVLNNGDGSADDVVIELVTLDGLSVAQGNIETSYQSIAPGEKRTLSWKLNADPQQFGANRFRIRVNGSNVEEKNVRRAVYVPLKSPKELSLTTTDDPSAIDLSWTDHASDAISGYRIYRGSNLSSLEEIASVGPDVTSYTDSELNDGFYLYAITAFGDDYIESDISNMQSYNINSATGEWSLVSIPIKGSVVSLDNSAIFGFNNTYQRSSELETLKGYWIKSNEGETYSSAGNRLLSASIDLSKGWNLVGALGNWVDPSTIEDPSGILTQTPIYTYRDGSYVEGPDLIEVGEGFWIYAAESGTVSMEAGVSQSSKTSTARKKDRVLADIDRIEFEAEGTKADFYMNRAEMSSQEMARYLLPPKAPSPQLDVRTSEGYKASDEKEVKLELVSDSYPVKVTVPQTHNNTSDSYRLIVHIDENEKYLDLLPGKTVAVSQDHDKIVLKRVGENEMAVENKLSPNYPNPFNPETTIKYQVGSQADVSMEVYNVLGQKVRTLVNEAKQPGTYNVRFNASDLASGIYYVRIQIGNFSEIQKMTLIK